MAVGSHVPSFGIFLHVLRSLDILCLLTHVTLSMYKPIISNQSKGLIPSSLVRFESGMEGAAMTEPTAAPAPGAHSPHGAAAGRWGVLMLSFSALGIIYGDIGTSPLYAYQAVFTSSPDPSTVLAATSLFFWTLTLIVLLKYVGIVIRFDDNGEGGTFALYSLMCRAAGFTPFGPAQPEELQQQASSAAAGPYSSSDKASARVTPLRWWSVHSPAFGGPLRALYTRSSTMQTALLLTVMMATAMVVGDGVLTPSISVLSAVSGLKVAFPAIQQGEVIGITMVVLILLFSVQYLGTAKISAVFAPVIAVWLLFNAAIGFYNLSTCGWGVWQAVSPHHAIAAFTGPGGFKAGWTLLAGVMLCITGAEAMYADLGHFNAQAVTLSFCGLVYPCLVVTYMGQAAYLTAHPDAYDDPFWRSIPKGAFWPMLIVATAATVVASQALISGVFSIMRQSMNLGVFPPMKVNHTDAISEGQIYIRQINFFLLLGCIAMVAGFQDTTALGHAYGVAVMSVMFITTFLSGIVMLVCYDVNPVLVTLFLILFVPLEGLFLSSNIIKIPEGGWVTIMIAVLVASVNLVWWYGSAAKQRWYKAQAAHNKGMLAQLPALVKLANADDHSGCTDHNSSAAQPLLLSHTSDPTALPHHAARSDASSGIEGRRSGAPLGRTQANGVSGLAAAASGKHDWRVQSAEVVTGSTGGLSQQQWAGDRVPARLQAASFTAGATSFPSFKGRRDAVTFNDTTLARLPGLGIVYTAATHGLPAVLQHMLINMPALYDITVLLTVRVLPQPYASQQERFLVRRSSGLAGMYRVIARYGYMEAVDQGPLFVRQLVTCLLKFAAQQDTQQQQAGVTNRRHINTQGSSHTSSHTQAASPDGSGAGTAAGGVGVDAAASKGLERWSRVAVAPTDGSVLEGALSLEGPALASSSFTRALSPSPSTSLDTATAAALRSSLATTSATMLGRESINRHQYGLQKMSYGGTRQGRTSSHAGIFASSSAGGAVAGTPVQSTGGAGGVGSSAGGGGTSRLSASSGGAALNGAHLITIPSGAVTSGAGAHLAAIPAGEVALVGLAPGAGGAAAAPAGADSLGDGGTAQYTDGGSSGTLIPALTPAQLVEIQLLLCCYRARAVYIMGRPQLAPQMAVDDGEGAERRRGLAAAGGQVRKLGMGLVAGAYRFLANNTHPSSEQWLLPDDQLLLVSMLVRV